MTEEDDIDILGDCSLDNFLNKNEDIFNTQTASDLLVSQTSDLLKCDYTIHPQWLLDKPSANPACWYGMSTLELSPDISTPDTSQTSSGNSISDESGWTEKEKVLLNRGIEIFGKSNARLAQFVGSKTPAEVKYYLKNFYSEMQQSGDSNVILDNYIQGTVVVGQDSDFADNEEILQDAEIPASIEEVIATVSTAKPTVNEATVKDKRKSATTSNVNYASTNEKSFKKKYLRKTLEEYVANLEYKKKNNRRSPVKHKKVKFKINEKVSKAKKHINLNAKPTRCPESLEDSFRKTDFEIVTGNGLSVPVSNGEEVIKIEREEDLCSDVEIDVVDSDMENKESIDRDFKNVVVKKEIPVTTTTNSPNTIIIPDKPVKVAHSQKQDDTPDLSILCEEDANFLKTLDLPKCEYDIDLEKVSEIEKFFHFEFFQGGPTKTPNRYLKIRNHILNHWKTAKPTYITKTSARQGLKHCGDVNCIGRIHHFLEQIGAINFNCAQVKYIRPLYDFLIAINDSAKEKTKENEIVVSTSKDCYQRNRHRKKYLHNGDGGLTLQHNDNGDVVNTMVVNEDRAPRKTYMKKPTVQLIFCKPFNEEHVQEFKVEISLITILLMDFHAHTSLSEVMGLVGGQWNDTRKVLTITRYEPCENIASSSTHCDMCPLSQAKASDALHNEHLDILGWFHSHPTFAPEPSQQDIETQLSVQQWIGYRKPCVGMILTPFSPHGALIASPYRCMVVREKEKIQEQYVPYKLKINVIDAEVPVDELLLRARKIFRWNYETKSKVDFSKSYLQDPAITYLEKFISSIKMHLAKCSNVSKMTCDAIVQGFAEIMLQKINTY